VVKKAADNLGLWILDSKWGVGLWVVKKAADILDLWILDSNWGVVW
jgi:hypothetical protein